MFSYLSKFLMYSRFSYSKRRLRTFILRILTKNMKKYPSRISTTDLWIKIVMCYQDTILAIQNSGIELKNIQSRHSWSRAMPMQNHMAISPCKIELSWYSKMQVIFSLLMKATIFFSCKQLLTNCCQKLLSKSI